MFQLGRLLEIVLIISLPFGHSLKSEISTKWRNCCFLYARHYSHLRTCADMYICEKKSQTQCGIAVYQLLNQVFVLSNSELVSFVLFIWFVFYSSHKNISLTGQQPAWWWEEITRELQNHLQVAGRLTFVAVYLLLPVPICLMSRKISKKNVCHGNGIDKKLFLMLLLEVGSGCWKTSWRLNIRFKFKSSIYMYPKKNCIFKVKIWKNLFNIILS